VPHAYEGARRHVGNPDLISRTHFARYIVELGVCADIPRVFDRFLVEGKPGFVPHRWARLADALGWIRGAGGVAVLAHPGRYALDEAALWELTTEFRDGGGEAIEVVCGSHGPADAQRFAGWARRFGLRASRGSDFHAPGEGRADLGTLASLPADLVPVWEGWA
jgi:predicted metal-dependent phosphoesterase TrpH